MDRQEAWLKARRYSEEQLELARLVLEDVREGTGLAAAIRRHPQPSGGYLPKHILIHLYHDLTGRGLWQADPTLLRRIRMKPIRTLSGVTTVTVLTKPYPCPGKCIFCPTDIRMPKSYLPDEPGAMRALQHAFDPFEQTAARIESLEAIGHPTDKVELLILGGTWSSYRRDYQAWFIQRCLDAMNDFESIDLNQAQQANTEAPHRNVGLVIETRPDHIDADEIRWLRYLGVTKVQMGAQSLDDGILQMNHRGHTVQQTRDAVRALRSAGFKIVLHWMPNLLGASLNSDHIDFNRLWDDTDLRPDEIKIYPCQLLENADLNACWKRGEYKPYTTDELIALIADIKPSIPRYCRVNRIIRDIPSTHVVEGNRRTSLRQDVHAELRRRQKTCHCIRCREVRGRPFSSDDVRLDDLAYMAGAGNEHFLSFVTREDRVAGYLRLFLPEFGTAPTGLAVLSRAALVRELHIYGQSLPLGASEGGAAQHSGLGGQLIAEAERLAAQAGFPRLAIIAALGTRGYYGRLGYRLAGSYMVKDLPDRTACCSSPADPLEVSRK
jgi:elongator complex protein 3